jgi:hypothetical protein
MMLDADDPMAPTQPTMTLAGVALFFGIIALALGFALVIL